MRAADEGRAGRRSKWRTAGLAAAIAAAVVLPASAQAGVVSVFPVPGSRTATPQTQITFRGVTQSALGPVTVTGSLSGVHAGRWVADSDGQGESFLPSKPFDAGETVTVKTGQDVLDGQAGAFSFTVAIDAPSEGGRAFAGMPRVRGDVYRFVSRRDLVPPAVRITKFPHHTEPGAIFVASQSGPVQSGPELVGPWGGLLFFQPVPRGYSATDFREQSYRGQNVLTWWQGTVSSGGTGTGVDEIYNDRYQPVATVRAGNGLAADLHEFQLTPQNTALITSYHAVRWNASAVHGSTHQDVLDAVVQEIDIPTGLVLFQWDSLDHVPLTDSHIPLPKSPNKPWDYFHVNSIQPLPDGNLLISGRNTWSVLDVSDQSARTQWILGGRHSSFTMAPGARFAFQHDARLRSPTVLTVFDDGAGPPAVHKQSRGLTLQLDLANHRASVIREDQHKGPLLAYFEGNVQVLANGDDFVGWGEQPFFSEFNSRGQEIFDGRFVGHTNSYRAYRFSWWGQPAAPPATRLRVVHGLRTLYVSWNGATDVSRWRLVGGPTPTSTDWITTYRKRTFETAMRLPHAYHYVVAEALGSHGQILSSSRPIKG
ncbi:MAG TPA: arylsulfotransferase family protein [Solirubrobacteraceae bacterium]|nr:arylsulfotransferase family protein [Solirubrobacteraceae bacterium]